mmetsp:Transcript_68051/g.148357  ORF Transcript_68051/g.148357 Transcript_68051/m.148357 type:complete len:434 (+) Transcript_68051:253-1554(+)
MYLDIELAWPALSVTWLPEEQGAPSRLAYGLHTDGSDPHEVIVVEMDFELLSELPAHPWDRWSIPTIGEAVGFGVRSRSLKETTGPIKPIARLPHPTEVNKLLACPTLPSLLATKAATGEVHLFDYRSDRFSPGGGYSVGGGSSSSSAPAAADATLAPQDAGEVDGFALSWGTGRSSNLLATGGNDGRLCVWDAIAAFSGGGRSNSLIHDKKKAHTEVCAVGFGRLGKVQTSLASVGSDGRLRLWDIRAGAARKASLDVRISANEMLAVDWSFHQEDLVATSGKAGVVQVWDLRSPKQPITELVGHSDEVVAVKWAAFQDGILATASSDHTLLLWNLDSEGPTGGESLDIPDNASKELIFTHSGHSQAVSDFSWCCGEELILSSVSEDCKLHIFQPSGSLLGGDEDSEEEVVPGGSLDPLGPCPPPAKRSRAE